jgi:hypothetical protein
MCRDLALAEWVHSPEEQNPATKVRRKPAIGAFSRFGTVVALEDSRSTQSRSEKGGV